MDPIVMGMEYLTRDGRRVFASKPFGQSGKGGATYGVYLKNLDGVSVHAVWGDGVYAGRYSTSDEHRNDLVSLFPPQYPTPQQLDLFDQ